MTTAAEVLAEAVGPTFYDQVPMRHAVYQVGALLAQTPEGEGVYIAADGTLARLVDGNDDCWADHYAIVPLTKEPTESATE